MHNFFSLVKVQFLSFFSTVSGAKKKSKKKVNLKALKFSVPILLGGLIFAVSYIYTIAYYELLALIGNPKELLPLMLSLSVMVSLVFSFYSAVKILFGVKDYDMLFSMPIKTHQVVLSKLVFSYVIDFCFSLIIILPSLIWHARFQVELNASLIINLFFLLLGAPLFSIFISTLLGFIIALISSKAKRKTLIETLFFALILCAYFVFVLLSSDEDVFAGNAMLISLIRKTYFLYPLVVNGITSFTSALMAFLIQLGTFLVVLVVVCIFYNKIHTLLVAKKTSRTYVKKDLNSNSIEKALYKKEVKRLFTSSVYVMNSLLGAVFSLVGSIVLLVLFISNGLNQVPMMKDLMVFAPALVILMFTMAPTTNCAISLEGKSFWVLKTAPVPFIKIANAKILTCLTFYMPVAVVTGVLVPIAFGVDIITGVLFFLISVFASLLSANAGLLINLLFPMFNWENEQKPVKQGVSVLVTMLFGFLISAIFGVFGYFVKIDIKIIFAIVLLIVAFLAMLFYNIIKQKGVAILERKE